MEHGGVCRASSRVKHPFDRTIRVPPAVATAMATIAKKGPTGIKEKRERVLDFWKSRKLELEAQEKSLKSKLDPEVARIVEPKAVLLFKEMLEEIRYDDMAVVELLTTGIKVSKSKSPQTTYKPSKPQPCFNET